MLQQGSDRNMVKEFDWLKKINNMLVEPDWPSMLVHKGQNKAMSFKLTKKDFAAANPDTRYCFY